MNDAAAVSDLPRGLPRLYAWESQRRGAERGGERVGVVGFRPPAPPRGAGGRRFPGLSLPHISPREVGSFEFFDGGRLLRLKGVGPVNQNPPPTRGTIKGMSRASARRCFDACMSIDRRAVGAGWFVTLTYPGQYPADCEQWKRDRDTFVKRLRREYPGICGLWKLEPQERLAPHYHLLLFPADGGRISKAWVSLAWYEVVGSKRPEHFRVGTRVERLRSWNGVTSYAAKYVAKEVDGKLLPEWWHGCRWWGRIGKLPTSPVQGELDPAAFFRACRQLRKYVSKATGRKVRTYGAAGIKVYASPEFARRLLGWAVGVKRLTTGNADIYSGHETHDLHEAGRGHDRPTRRSGRAAGLEPYAGHRALRAVRAEGGRAVRGSDAESAVACGTSGGDADGGQGGPGGTRPNREDAGQDRR